jgi:hypothetical protein
MVKGNSMGLNISQHISAQFNEELEDVMKQTMTMGGLVEQQLRDAIIALNDKDDVLADHIIEKDSIINKMEVNITEACVKIIAKRQPTASDLRLLIVGIKVSAELERIGATQDAPADSGDFARWSFEFAVVRVMRALQPCDSYAAATAAFHRELFVSDSPIARLIAIVLAGDYLRFANGDPNVRAAAVAFCIAACDTEKLVHALPALGVAFLTAACDRDVFAAFFEKLVMTHTEQMPACIRCAGGIALMMGIVGFAGLFDMGPPIELLIEYVPDIERSIGMAMFPDDVAFAAMAFLVHGGELAKEIGWPIANALVRDACCSSHIVTQLKDAVAQFETAFAASE